MPPNLVQPRGHNFWMSASPEFRSNETIYYLEEPSENFLWSQLHQYSEVPELGRSLFNGSRKYINDRLRQFQSFISQAHTYWDAAILTRGSASALPFYYCALNLAKAELLTQSNFNPINVTHGLRSKTTASSTITKDTLSLTDGVFTRLWEKRTGASVDMKLKLKAKNLLSIIPEIGLEMEQIGFTRPHSPFGYESILTDNFSAWPMLAIASVNDLDDREPLSKIIFSEFDPVDLTYFPSWKQIFGLSGRMKILFNVYQSKQVFSLTSNNINTPDLLAAREHVLKVFKEHLSPPIKYRSDFLLTPTLIKSTKVVLPLDLARYAALFYLSSLVRYRPYVIDSRFEGSQSWVMNTFTYEVPINILAGALMGISGQNYIFEMDGYRS